MGVEDVPKLFGRVDKREKNHCLPVRARPRHFFGNLLQVRLQGTVKVARPEVARLHTHAGEVQLQRDSLRLNRAQVAVPDSAGQGVLKGQRFKHRAQVAHVAPVRGRCDAQHPRPVEVLQDPEIAVTECVVGLVDDDGVEVVRCELVQPLFPHEGLDAAHDNAKPAPFTALLRLFNGALQPSSFLELVRCLVE